MARKAQTAKDHKDEAAAGRRNGPKAAGSTWGRMPKSRGRPSVHVRRWSTKHGQFVKVDPNRSRIAKAAARKRKKRTWTAAQRAAHGRAIRNAYRTGKTVHGTKVRKHLWGARGHMNKSRKKQSAVSRRRESTGMKKAMKTAKKQGPKARRDDAAAGRRNGKKAAGSTWGKKTPAKRGPGRPKGSKNKPKTQSASARRAESRGARKAQTPRVRAKESRGAKKAATPRVRKAEGRGMKKAMRAK